MPTIAPAAAGWLLPLLPLSFHQQKVISSTLLIFEDGIRDKIFDMFYWGSELSTGSGLGLFVVKKLLKNLNGSIMVESSVCNGRVFKLQLPVPKR